MRHAVTDSDGVPRVTRLGPVPGNSHRGLLEGTAVSGSRLARRVAELGCRIAAEYDGKEVVVVALLKGSVLFVADLIRHCPGPMKIDFIGVSSYRGGVRPGHLEVTAKLQLDVRGREVLVVDDILDTGRTLAEVRRQLETLGASRVRVCVLLDKESRRETEVKADFVGFRIPDWFVVGYGLDFEERLRNLPFIGVLRQSGDHPRDAARRTESK